MTIEAFIIDLLKYHNCVVVPNFGGFIANYQPAIIDSISKTITPPSKQVLFNANLLKNDGLLANHIADKKNISYPESLAEIDDKAKEWKAALANEKRLVFGEIGFLYEQDGTVVFEQNRETNLWLKAYGLSSIQFVSAKDLVEKEASEQILIQEQKPIINESKKELIEEPTISLSVTEKIESVSIPSEKDETIVIPLEPKQKSRKKWGYIAVACAIPLLFYVYWIPMNTNFLETGNIQLSDFNPFHVNRLNSTYKKRENVPYLEQVETLETFGEKIEDLSDNVTLYHYQFDESIYIPVTIDSEPISNEIFDNETVGNIQSTQKMSPADAPLQLIAGCFSVQKNAEGLVIELKKQGYPAYILDKHKGLNRVSVNGFQEMKAAKSAKSDLKSKSYSTWILKQ